MRLIRWLGALVALVIIVTVAGGYSARTTELARERDRWVSTASAMTAADFNTVLAVITTASELSDDPDEAVAVAVSSWAGAATICAGGLGRAMHCEAGGRGEVAADQRVAIGAVLRDAARTEADTRGSVHISVNGAEAVLVRSGARLDIGAHLRLDVLAATEHLPIDVELIPRAELGPEMTADGAASVVDGRSMVALPVPSAPTWVVVASTPADVALDPAERNVIVLLLGLAGLVLVMVAVTVVADRRRLVDQARLDPLTRLPHRGELEHRAAPLVQAARRNVEGLCVMMIDLDGFKEVNDTHGHQYGDEVLKAISMRLRNAVRHDDLVARWGGDEFVIVLRNVGDPDLAVSRAATLARLVVDPLRTTTSGGPAASGMPYGVGASIGVALLGHHGGDLEELIQAADTAMYAAKRAGEPYRLATYAGDRALAPH